MTIAMELFEVRIDETSNEQIIILREKHGQRLLPIVIGMFEAQSIHVKINNIPLPRPLTHDLLGNVIEALTYLLCFDLSHGKNSDTASNTAATIARIEAVCFFLASICDWSAYMRDPPVDEAGR